MQPGRADQISHPHTETSVARSAQAPHTLDLSAATPPSKPPVARIDAAALIEALAKLGPSDLRAELFERHAALKKGTLPSPNREEDSQALLVAAHMEPGLLREALTKLFTQVPLGSHTVPQVDMLFIPPTVGSEDYSATLQRNAQSLLESGVFPRSEVYLHTQALVLSLLDNRFDSMRTILPIGGGVGVALVSTVAPWWATVSAGALGLLLCSAFATRMSLRNEYAAGYQLELMDAHAIVERGNVEPLGISLNKIFNDPSAPKNYGNLLRVEGFLIARTLRVLGHHQDEILKIFQESPTSYEQGELLAKTLSDTLAKHEKTMPNYLFPTFIVEELTRDRDEGLGELVELMNQVHFEWVIVERDQLREKWGKIVLDVAKAN